MIFPTSGHPLFGIMLQASEHGARDDRRGRRRRGDRAVAFRLPARLPQLRAPPSFSPSLFDPEVDFFKSLTLTDIAADFFLLVGEFLFGYSEYQLDDFEDSIGRES